SYSAPWTPPPAWSARTRRRSWPSGSVRPGSASPAPATRAGSRGTRSAARSGGSTIRNPPWWRTPGRRPAASGRAAGSDPPRSPAVLSAPRRSAASSGCRDERSGPGERPRAALRRAPGRAVSESRCAERPARGGPRAPRSTGERGGTPPWGRGVRLGSPCPSPPTPCGRGGTAAGQRSARRSPPCPAGAGRGIGAAHRPPRPTPCEALRSGHGGAEPRIVASPGPRPDTSGDPSRTQRSLGAAPGPARRGAGRGRGSGAVRGAGRGAAAGVLDGGQRGGAVLPAADLRALPGLQPLVDLEEVVDLLALELWQVAQVADVLQARVAGRHAQHLGVRALLVAHPEHRHRPDPHH